MLDRIVKINGCFDLEGCCVETLQERGDPDVERAVDAKFRMRLEGIALTLRLRL